MPGRRRKPERGSRKASAFALVFSARFKGLNTWTRVPLKGSTRGSMLRVTVRA